MSIPAKSYEAWLAEMRERMGDANAVWAMGFADGTLMPYVFTGTSTLVDGARVPISPSTAADAKAVVSYDGDEWREYDPARDRYIGG